MEIENIFIIFILLFNFLLIFFFNKIKLFHINIDNPDGKRKLHKKPIPLAGGIIIFLNLLIYSLFISQNLDILSNETVFRNLSDFYLFLITFSLIFSLGFIDDKFNISASKKFLFLFILIIPILYLDNLLNIKILKFSFLEKKFYLSRYFQHYYFFVFVF